MSITSKLDLSKCSVFSCCARRHRPNQIRSFGNGVAGAATIGAGVAATIHDKNNPMGWFLIAKGVAECIDTMGGVDKLASWIDNMGCVDRRINSKPTLNRIISEAENFGSGVAMASNGFPDGHGIYVCSILTTILLSLHENGCLEYLKNSFSKYLKSLEPEKRYRAIIALKQVLESVKERAPKAGLEIFGIFRDTIVSAVATRELQASSETLGAAALGASLSIVPAMPFEISAKILEHYLKKAQEEAEAASSGSGGAVAPAAPPLPLPPPATPPAGSAAAAEAASGSGGSAAASSGSGEAEPPLPPPNAGPAGSAAGGSAAYEVPTDGSQEMDHKSLAFIFSL